MPAYARVLATEVCDRCGEGVMESRIRVQAGQKVCLACAGEDSISSPARGSAAAGKFEAGGPGVGLPTDERRSCNFVWPRVVLNRVRRVPGSPGEMQVKL